MTKHGQGKRNQPTCKSDRKPRSATLGFQKPTTPQDRWERNLAKLHAWVETKSCRELFDDELDRGDLACCECLCRRYYLPGAQAIGRWSKEELEGLLVGPNACTGYSREKVLPFMVDKAGTCNPRQGPAIRTYVQTRTPTCVLLRSLPHARLHTWAVVGG